MARRATTAKPEQSTEELWRAVQKARAAHTLVGKTVTADRHKRPKRLKRPKKPELPGAPKRRFSNVELKLQRRAARKKKPKKKSPRWVKLTAGRYKWAP